MKKEAYVEWVTVTNERFYDLNLNEYIKDTILVLNAVRVFDNHRIHFEPDDIVERRI